MEFSTMISIAATPELLMLPSHQILFVIHKYSEEALALRVAPYIVMSTCDYPASHPLAYAFSDSHDADTMKALLEGGVRLRNGESRM
jgi:hypothetical protein